MMDAESANAVLNVVGKRLRVFEDAEAVANTIKDEDGTKVIIGVEGQDYTEIVCLVLQTLLVKLPIEPEADAIQFGEQVIVRYDDPNRKDRVGTFERIRWDVTGEKLHGIRFPDNSFLETTHELERAPERTGPDPDCVDCGGEGCPYCGGIDADYHTMCFDCHCVVRSET